MKEVHQGIFVGSEADCRKGAGDWAVIHACKFPCHRAAVGYATKIARTHPYYLVMEREQNLYLNIIDPEEPLFMLPLFTNSLEFSRRCEAAGKKLLFHCNKGDSRAPSLALLHLAKNRGVLNATSFDTAKLDFRELYPMYAPGLGIQRYLREHWHEL